MKIVKILHNEFAICKKMDVLDKITATTKLDFDFAQKKLMIIMLSLTFTLIGGLSGSLNYHLSANGRTRVFSKANN